MQILKATAMAAILAFVPAFAGAQSRCEGLRAANGRCASLDAVEDAQARAMIITTVRVSEIGTPIGEVGSYVRLFQEAKSPLYGLPNSTYWLLQQTGKDTIYRIVRTR